MWITAAVLAEICSALPLSGSIYIWAAESAGPDYARFFGFVVAWWSSTAWMTFAASNCQVGISRPHEFELLSNLPGLTHRPLLTISYLNCPSGRSISQGERTMITSSGVPSSGQSPKAFWYWPLPSIAFPQECIRSFSNSPLGCISSISSCASSGFPSGCRKHTGSVPRKRCSQQHVSIPFELPANLADNVGSNRQRHRCPSWMELDLILVCPNCWTISRFSSSFPVAYSQPGR